MATKRHLCDTILLGAHLQWVLHPKADRKSSLTAEVPPFADLCKTTEFKLPVLL